MLLLFLSRKTAQYHTVRKFAVDFQSGSGVAAILRYLPLLGIVRQYRDDYAERFTRGVAQPKEMRAEIEKRFRPPNFQEN